MVKSISLKVPATDITDNLIRELLNSVEKKDGKASLKFIVYDPENKRFDVIPELDYEDPFEIVKEAFLTASKIPLSV